MGSDEEEAEAEDPELETLEVLTRDLVDFGVAILLKFLKVGVVDGGSVKARDIVLRWVRRIVDLPGDFSVL